MWAGPSLELQVPQRSGNHTLNSQHLPFPLDILPSDQTSGSDCTKVGDIFFSSFPASRSQTAGE